MNREPRTTTRELPRRPPTPGARLVNRSAAAAGASFWLQERASFAFALQGLHYCWRTQRHLRIHASCAAVIVGAGFVLSLSRIEWIGLLGIFALVTSLELINTVVEVVVDMITPDFHPQAKVAKDVAAGAVLIAAVAALLVGALIFAPHILSALRRF